jgi:predicted DNA-binding transcriptional regulator AlpA
MEQTVETLVPARKIRERYGVSDMSLWRWLQSEKLRFPKPIRINGRRYWRVADIRAWEAAPARGDQ